MKQWYRIGSGGNSNSSKVFIVLNRAHESMLHLKHTPHGDPSPGSGASSITGATNGHSKAFSQILSFGSNLPPLPSTRKRHVSDQQSGRPGGENI